MALSSDALTTLADLKQYLELSTAENDDLLERLIEAVSARFNRHTGRNLAARDYSPDPEDAAHDPDNAVLGGSGRAELILPQYPVISLTSLAVDGRAVPSSAGPGQPGWVLDRAAGVLAWRGGVFPAGVGNVEVAYRAGYAAIPPDLAQAALEQAAMAFADSTAGGGRLGQSGRSLADGSVSYSAGGLLPQVKDVLGRYLRRSPL